MKQLLLITTLVCSGVSFLFADSDVEREFKVLERQREKDVAAALEPIDRRYAAALQQLLSRATQAKDLNAATRITNALKSLNGAQQASATGMIGTWIINREGYPPKEREFKEDGTVVRSDGPPGKWTIDGSLFRVEYPGGRMSVFQLPPQNKRMSGKSEDGDAVTAQKK